MSADRKLLEMAAKAAGYEFCESVLRPGVFQIRIRPRQQHLVDWTDWAPLTDDGDALRLAVELGLHISPEDDCVDVWHPEHECAATEEYGNDRAAATRRAIVQAAAAIGEAMP